MGKMAVLNSTWCRVAFFLNCAMGDMNVPNNMATSVAA